MSKENINQNPLIDLSNFNPNKVIDFSFNYELLKYVLTALINNQQNLTNEISKLKLDNLKQKKNSVKLASEIIELKLQRASSPEELENLNNKKNEINSQCEQYDNDLEYFQKEINDQSPKKEVKLYNMKNKETESKNEITDKENISEMNNKVDDSEKINEKKEKKGKKEDKDKMILIKK